MPLGTSTASLPPESMDRSTIFPSSASAPLDLSGIDPQIISYVIQQQIADAERTVNAFNLSDLRVSVSAFGPRAATMDRGFDGKPRPTADNSLVRSSNGATGDILVRLRILPAVRPLPTSETKRSRNAYQVLKSGTF